MRGWLLWGWVMWGAIAVGALAFWSVSIGVLVMAATS